MRTTMLATLVLTVAVHAADMAGHYNLQNVREMGSELLLKPDGRFEFFLAYGAADYWSKGTWQAQNGAVLLNTDGEPKPPFRVLNSSESQKDSLRIFVGGTSGRPVPNIDVVLEGADGPAQARTDSEGVAHFPPIKGLRSVTFRIRVYQFESEPLSLNPAHNDFRFEIDGSEITQVRFKDEPLAVDGTSLLLRHWGSEHPMRYAKH
jgi:hypothetical protein